MNKFKRLEVGKCYRVPFYNDFENVYIESEFNHNKTHKEEWKDDDTYSYFCVMTNKNNEQLDMDCGIYLWSFYTDIFAITKLGNAVELVGKELDDFKNSLKMFKK